MCVSFVENVPIHVNIYVNAFQSNLVIGENLDKQIHFVKQFKDFSMNYIT